jgi:hypothetical protein
LARHWWWWWLEKRQEWGTCRDEADIGALDTVMMCCCFFSPTTSFLTGFLYRIHIFDPIEVTHTSVHHIPIMLSAWVVLPSPV